MFVSFETWNKSLNAPVVKYLSNVVPSILNYGPAAPSAGCDVTKTIEATTSLPALRRLTRFDTDSSNVPGASLSFIPHRWLSI